MFLFGGGSPLYSVWGLAIHMGHGVTMRISDMAAVSNLTANRLLSCVFRFQR